MRDRRESSTGESRRWRCSTLAVLLVVAAVSGAFAQGLDLEHEMTVVPNENGQSDFGFPDKAAASPDGRHLYVTTFFPFRLLTFERTTDDLVLRDTLGADDGLVFDLGDVVVSADGSFVVLTSFSTPAAIYVLSRDQSTGLLTLTQTIEHPELAVVDQVEAGVDRVVVSGQGPVMPVPPFDSDGVQLVLDRTSPSVRALRTQPQADGTMLAPAGPVIVKPSARIRSTDVERRGDAELTAALWDDGIVDVYGEDVVNVCSLTLKELEAGLDVSPTATPITIDILGIGADAGHVILQVLYDDGSIVGATIDVEGCRVLINTYVPPEEEEEGEEEDVGYNVGTDLPQPIRRPEHPEGPPRNVTVLGGETVVLAHEGFSEPVIVTFDDLVSNSVSTPTPERVRPSDVTASALGEANQGPDQARPAVASSAGAADPVQLSASIYTVSPSPPRIIGYRLTTDAQLGDPCFPNDTTACLSGFATTVNWEDRRGNRGDGHVVPGGSSDSGLFWFFSPDNWELLLKVLDGCAVNGHFWVLYAATTNVGFGLSVADPSDPAVVRRYENFLGELAPAVADTRAFLCNDQQMKAATERIDLRPGSIASELAHFQNEAARLRSGGPEALSPTGGSPRSCTSAATSLCLSPDRFQVEVAWRDFSDNTGVGQVVPLRSSDSGLFWFFDPDNWEMLIKVLDGCALNGNFWLLTAATTNVEYEITVTDTRTGEQFVGRNEAGTTARAVIDTAAFRRACGG